MLRRRHEPRAHRRRHRSDFTESTPLRYVDVPPAPARARTRPRPAHSSAAHRAPESARSSTGEHVARLPPSSAAPHVVPAPVRDAPPLPSLTGAPVSRRKTHVRARVPTGDDAPAPETHVRAFPGASIPARPSRVVATAALVRLDVPAVHVRELPADALPARRHYTGTADSAAGIRYRTDGGASSDDDDAVPDLLVDVPDVPLLPGRIIVSFRSSNLRLVNPGVVVHVKNNVISCADYKVV